METVAFVVPTRASTWPLPMYELALMTRGRAQRRRILLVTPEPAPLALFGEEPSREIGELLAHAGIEVHVGRGPRSSDGRALGPTGPAEPVDRGRPHRLPAGRRRPAARGRAADARGFIPVDEHCRVPGLDRVYAAGDGTDAPVKQGGLAAQQADAAWATSSPRPAGSCPAEPFRPVLRGRLVTGQVDRYLRHDPEAGDAILAQPLWEPAAKVVGRHLAPWLAYLHPTHPLPRNDVGRVTVDHELDLEPLGRIERQRS